MSESELQIPLSPSRRRFLIGVACACVSVILGIGWFGLRGQRSTVSPNLAPEKVASPDTSLGRDGHSQSDLVRRPIESTERPNGVIPVEPPPLVTPGPPEILSGRVKFADGSPPPELTLQATLVPIDDQLGFADLIARSQASERLGKGRTWASARTEVDGSFSFDGLKAGRYSLSLGTHSGLGILNVTGLAPSVGNEFVLPGYVLTVRVVASDGTDCKNAMVSAVYQRDPDEFKSNYPPILLTSAADENARYAFCLPASGECAVTARSGDLSATSEKVVLRGGPSVVTSTVLLEGISGSASLLVNVRECGSAGSLVPVYCIALLDSITHEMLVRACSEDANAAGIIEHLPPGHYDAIVVDRFRDPPALYECNASPVAVPVELRDGGETTLDLCVRLGGRLSLSVTNGDGQQQTTQPREVRAELEVPDGGPALKLYFRDPYEGGMRILDGVVPGQELVSTRLFESGTYNVLLQVPGAVRLQRVVTVRSGEIAKIVVELPLK